MCNKLLHNAGKSVNCSSCGNACTVIICSNAPNRGKKLYICSTQTCKVIICSNAPNRGKKLYICSTQTCNLYLSMWTLTHQPLFPLRFWDSYLLIKSSHLFSRFVEDSARVSHGTGRKVSATRSSNVIKCYKCGGAGHIATDSNDGKI